MRLKKFIEFAEEVEIHMTVEDLEQLFAEEPTASLRIILSQINSFASFLKAVPKETLEQMSGGARQTISEFFSEQAQRFKVEKEKKGDLWT